MKNINLIYPAAIGALVLSHIMTLLAPIVFSWFDLIIVIYFLFYEKLDSKNFIWISIIFGLYSDYLRGGFVGPAIMLFILFSASRFKVDLALDMTKLKSQMLLYACASLIYSTFNASLSGYDIEVMLRMILIRTALDIVATFCVLKLAGYVIAFKNS